MLAAVPFVTCIEILSVKAKNKLSRDTLPLNCHMQSLLIMAREKTVELLGAAVCILFREVRGLENTALDLFSVQYTEDQHNIMHFLAFARLPRVPWAQEYEPNSQLI